ncbi:MAG TPA: MBL fold metallo-hydrolase [Longimicrobiales bacterium]|nr:MBL fold metallo-hydrolase [Longimicrobiales bacterium]
MSRVSSSRRFLLWVTALTAACSGGEPGADRAGSGDAETSAERRALAPTDVFRIDSLAEGVWVAEVLQRPEAYAFANSLVVAGDSALLVVDTQQSPAAARALIAWIRETFDRPVRWVVNTHFHGDHVNGNVAYRETWPEVQFVAHASVPEAIRTEGRARIEEERSTLPATLDRRQAWLDGDTLPEGQEMTPELRDRLAYSVRVGSAYLDELRELEVLLPDALVEAPRSFDLGGRSVDVVPVGPAHTAGDLVVWVPDAGVAGVGDIVEEAAPWIEGADLRGWAAALARVTALDPGRVVPSHGSAARGRELLEGLAPLFADLVRAAEREAQTPAADGAAWPTAAAVDRVVESLAPHRAFLASVGVEGTAFTEWASEAARQALTETERGRSR